MRDFKKSSISILQVPFHNHDTDMKPYLLCLLSRISLSVGFSFFIIFSQFYPELFHRSSSVYVASLYKLPHHKQSHIKRFETLGLALRLRLLAKTPV